MKTFYCVEHIYLLQLNCLTPSVSTRRHNSRTENKEATKITLRNVVPPMRYTVSVRVTVKQIYVCTFCLFFSAVNCSWWLTDLRR